MASSFHFFVHDFNTFLLFVFGAQNAIHSVPNGFWQRTLCMEHCDDPYVTGFVNPTLADQVHADCMRNCCRDGPMEPSDL